MLRTYPTYQSESPDFGKSERYNLHNPSDKQDIKDTKKKYKVKIRNISCHTFRKTFGRQVYNMNDSNSELALVKLLELFNHSSIAITKRYLGLRQEEILQTYNCLTF